MITTNNAVEKWVLQEKWEELDKVIDRSYGVFSSSKTRQSFALCTFEQLFNASKRLGCYEFTRFSHYFQSLMYALSPKFSKSAFHDGVEKEYGNFQASWVATMIRSM